MVFNPLFLQNTTGVENIHPEKVNKLNSSGYLFSDIINVFMNSEEGDSLTKLTQEFLGSAQIKENNGKPVILSLLGESSLPLNNLTKNLQLKIEDFLPANLKKNLVKVENENNKNISEKSLTANQSQLAQILQTINNLFAGNEKGGKLNADTSASNTGENTKLDLTAAEKLLEESDGVFFIVETSDKIFNINISKQVETGNSATSKTETENNGLYKIKFTLVNENSLLNSQNNGTLAFNGRQNNSQLSFLPFESELANEDISAASAVKLKMFTYQNSGSENNLTLSKVNKNNSVNIIDPSVKPVNEVVTSKNSVENVAFAKSEKVIETAGANETGKAEAGKTSSNSNVIKENIKETTNINSNKTAEEKSLNNKANEQNNKNENLAANELKQKTGKNFTQNTSQQVDEKNSLTKNDPRFSEVKAEGSQKTVLKGNVESIPKTELKNSFEQKFENKKEELQQAEKPLNEKAVEKNNTETNPKTFEKFAAELKENEQLNIKVAKAVKNITTVKAENSNHQAAEKPLKENVETKTELKTNQSEDKAGSIKTAESNEKNFSQSENSSKQSEENKHVPLDANRINSTQAKEKFTLDAPTPHSNSERIVKAAEIMKEISKFIEKQDKSTLTIRVSPEDLGKLKITLDIVEHSVKANIHVENEAVKSIVEKNIVELQNQMSKSGIQLTSVNVSLSESDQKNTKQFVNKKKSNSIELNEQNIEENEDEKVKMMGYNTMEYLA